VVYLPSIMLNKIVNQGTGAATGRLVALKASRWYSMKVNDHFYQPRNIGSLNQEDPKVGSAIVGKASCGDVIRFQVKVNDDDIIEDVKFKAFGCGSAIASTSYVSTMMKGLTMDAALAIKNTEVANALSLPPVKIHCSLLAEDAVKRAIADLKRKRNMTSGVEA